MNSSEFYSQFQLQYRIWKSFNFEHLNDSIPHKTTKRLNDINKKIELIENIKELIPINLQNKKTIDVFTNINKAILQLNNQKNLGEERNVSKENLDELKNCYIDLLNIWPHFNGPIQENKSKETNEKIKVLEYKKTVDIQIENFKKSAATNDTESRKWLAGIAIALILLIIIIYLFTSDFCFELSCFNNINNYEYSHLNQDGKNSILYLEIFKSASFRLFILSTAVYILHFCVNNFRASKHNQTINLQKSNSLNAALQILDTAKSTQAKDEIMIRAADAIFSHQTTGYNKKESLKNTPIAQRILDTRPHPAELI